MRCGASSVSSGALRSAPPSLPEAWAEVATPEGGIALVPNPATRRAQTRVAAFFALAALGMTAVFGYGTAEDPSWLSPALISGGCAAALAAGTAWLAAGRNEWRVEPGRLVYQRRFGAA